MRSTSCATPRSSPSTSEPQPHRSALAKPPNVLVGAIPNQAGGCALPTEGGKVLIENAAQPDWSPAPVPTITNGGGKDGSGSQGGAYGGAASNGGGAVVDGASPNPQRPGVSVTVPATTLAKALSGGLAVRLTVPGAGKLDVVATRSGKKVAAGTAKPKGAGETKVKLRFTAAAKKALRRSGSVTLTLRHTFTPTGGAPVTGTTKVKLGKKK